MTTFAYKYPGENGKVVEIIPEHFHFLFKAAVLSLELREAPYEVQAAVRLFFSEEAIGEAS